MPQLRYYHQGRYYRPARSMPLLPPLSLVPSVDTSKHNQLKLGCPSDEETVARRWKTRRDKEFRWMVRYIAESLTGENIADMRFLCRDHVNPPEVLRQTMKGSRLMAILERQRLLAENSLFFLQTLLYYISRPDLYELVLEYRTKRQNDMRRMGVEITYGMNTPSERGLALTKDLKSFRKSLKPRSRFNTVDIQAMMKRLAELKAKMQSQLPKTLDASYADSVLSTVSATSDVSDSEWEDVDTDYDIDNDDDRDYYTISDETVDDVGNAATHKDIGETAKSYSLGANKKQHLAKGSKGDGAHVHETEKLRLPRIETKTKIHVKVKTGRDSESDYEDDYEDDFKDDNETIDDDRNKKIEDRVEFPPITRVPGPSKPIHNFTHRSSEFEDLKVNGKQTYNDDDVIACVRDVNKVKGGINDNSELRKNGVAHPTVTPAPSLATSQVAVKPAPVPLKFKVLRRKYRKNSPGRFARKAVKRHKTSKTLPQVSRTSQKESLEQLKTTRSIPNHDPQRINFLPDIYDKYARKSVSNAIAKTPTSKKSKHR